MKIPREVDEKPSKNNKYLDSRNMRNIFVKAKKILRKKNLRNTSKIFFKFAKKI